LTPNHRPTFSELPRPLVLAIMAEPLPEFMQFMNAEQRQV